MAPKPKTIPEKLLNYSVAQNGCWEWRGYKLSGGYGAFKQKGKMLTAHRASYKLHIGQIPDGMCVCHKCDNRACINPDHLWLGTSQENTQDRHNKGRSARGERAACSKLKEQDVRLIRSMATYITRREIAEIYGINLRSVYKVLRNEIWGHVA